MSHNSSAKMNEILSQPTANAAHFTGHRAMIAEPIVRSMSDASEITRRSNGPSTGIFSNLDYNRVLNSPRTGGMFLGHNQASLASGARPQSQVEDEDYDLNMVFEEIGALQKTGLDESEDDGNGLLIGSLPSVSQLSSALQHLQQQQQQQSISQSSMGQQKQQHLHNSTGHGPAKPTHPPPTAVAHTSDGKIVSYNPELYDEADVVLANEKYPQNIR